jgi:hypothetical protein
MSRVACQISMSLDGFVAGPRQSLEHPLGEGGGRLHEWVFRDVTDVDAAVFAGLFDGAGGADTVQQVLAAGELEELHLHVVPTLLGEGERLFDGLSGVELEPVEVVASPVVTHVRYRVVR